ncbi:AAA family ATPase [Kitasatospora sp. NPDC127116]|uniref:AAA family ATPase n=1 Tax=Kitasatospora sp. NPDC127116 TaxID=3345367 RepID=UPI00362ABA3C
MTFSFQPATREQAKARIALQGPGGSGKTKSALRIAEGLTQGGTIGVVDTERGSALKYAPVPGRPDLGGHTFGHLPLAVCSPENLIAAVAAAEQARVAVLIIDSWSHFWAGKGGLLARVDQESKKPGHFGGSYTAWAPVNELEQNMLDALLGFPGHVIVTMRTKNDYEMEGKKVTKIGVKTVQREGAEYEVDVVIDMIEGVGTVTKTRYEPLNGLTVHHPGEDLAETILEQLGQGVDPVQQILNELFADGMTYQGALELHARAKQRSLLDVEAARPGTGEVSTLGELIVGHGTALKPTAVPAAASASEPPREAPAAARPEPGRTVAEPAPATAPQMRRIHAVLNEVGIRDRDERHTILGALIGRPISSANELTKHDAGEVIESLEAALAQPDPGEDLRRTARNISAAA